MLTHAHARNGKLLFNFNIQAMMPIMSNDSKSPHEVIDQEQVSCYINQVAGMNA